MQHSHNTTHTLGNSSFLCLSSREGLPGSTGMVYPKSFVCGSYFTTVATKFFTPQSTDAFAPFGPVQMQSLLPKARGNRAGAIVDGSLIPAQSTVTKTITEQTPYPELFVSRFVRGQVTNNKSKFQISTRVGLDSASRIFNHLNQEKSDANYTQT